MHSLRFKTYLDNLLEIPFGKVKKESIDLNSAKKNINSNKRTIQKSITKLQ